MTHVNQNYTEEEFLTFVLIYAAHVDLEFSAEEREMIFANTSKETFEKVYGDFKELSDFAALQTILGYKDTYFSTDEQKDKLVATVKKIFKVDGEFSTLEKLVLNFVDRLVS